MINCKTENNSQTQSCGSLIDETLYENQLTDCIISSAIEVHKILGGPGLLESIYEDALAHELELRNITVKRQLSIPVFYKGVQVRDPLRLDLLVNDRIIIEVKSAEKNLEVHSSQVLTYLRLTQYKLGLVLNFGLPRLRDGISRVVNNF